MTYFLHFWVFLKCLCKIVKLFDGLIVSKFWLFHPVTRKCDTRFLSETFKALWLLSNFTVKRSFHCLGFCHPTCKLYLRCTLSKQGQNYTVLQLLPTVACCISAHKMAKSKSYTICNDFAFTATIFWWGFPESSFESTRYMYAAVVSKLSRTVTPFYFLQECSEKGTQVTWQNIFSLVLSAIYFTNTKFWIYELIW